MKAERDLPDSEVSYTGGSAGAMAGTTRADLKRGYSDCTHRPEDHYLEEPMPDPAERGFAGRPHGWER